MDKQYSFWGFPGGILVLREESAELRYEREREREREIEIERER